MSTRWPKVAQGLLLTEPFYWDLNDKTRRLSERFAKLLRQDYPTSNQAGVLLGRAALPESGGRGEVGRDGKKVIERDEGNADRRSTLLGKGEIREDGRDMYPTILFQAKAPAEF